MGELRAQVDVVGPPFDGVEVLAERFPRPLDPLVEHRARNVLHTLHQRNETVVRIGSHRCEAHAAVAHDAVVTPCQLDGVMRASHVACPS